MLSLLVPLLLTALGCMTLRRLMPGTPWPLQCAWGWLGAQAAVSLAGGLLVPIGWSLRLALLAPLLVLLVAHLYTAHLYSRRRTTASPSLASPSSANSDAMLRALTLLLSLWAIITAWTTLDLGWDGMAIWGLKAHTLAETGTYALHHPLARSSHPEYPLHLPLLAAVIAQWAGDWHDRLLPMLAAFDLTALGLLLCSTLEGRRGPAWTRRTLLLAGLTVPVLWRELTLGKADINVACCLAGALAGFEGWRRHGRDGYLRLAALSVGLAAWSKQEGLVYVVIFCALTWLASASSHPKSHPRAIRIDRREAGLASAIALGIALPWHGFRVLFGLSTEPFGLQAGGLREGGLQAVLSDRLPTILHTMTEAMARLDLWGVLWWLALPALLWFGVKTLRPSEARRAFDGTTLFLTAGLGFIVTAYVSSPYDVAWHLHTSLDRLLLQLLPAAILVAHRALDAMPFVTGSNR